MHIAYLSYSTLPSQKANAVNVMGMCAAFARLGHRVTLFARPGHDPAVDVHARYGVAREFEILFCRRPAVEGVGGVIYGWQVGRAVRSRPLPDLFYARDLYSLAAVAGLGRPLIFESHAAPHGPAGWGLQRWLFARKNFLRLVVISQALAREYRRLFPRLPEERLLVAPSAAAAMDGASTPPPLPGNGGRPRIGYVGQLYHGKGAEVVTELARRMPEADFHLVGGAEELVASCRRASQGQGNVHFHGHVAPPQTEPFRQAMDVLLAPYQRAVFTEHGSRNIAPWMSPLKIVEYMRSRKPIVASDLPAVCELLQHEVNALLVPATDLEAWARAIRRLLGNAALRERLSARASQDAQERFDILARARAVLEGAAA